MRYPLLLSVIMAFCVSAHAQDGAAIYKGRCASCHDVAKERTPPLSAIKAMSPQAVSAALTTGTMRSQAEGLSSADLIALISYIAPTGGTAPAPVLVRTCKQDAPALATRTSDWTGWSPGLVNARFQDSRAAGLGVHDI